MLTAIRAADETKVQARFSLRVKGPYLCPDCREHLTLAKGDIRIHHFRHRAATTDCRRQAGESEAHMACKDAIYAALARRPNVRDLELEHRVGDNIADVYAVINGISVAIEVQRSNLTVDAIARRTLGYHRSGVFALWLALLTEDACFADYSPSAWERWCHAAYGGRVYYWVEHDLIQPIHFGPAKQKVPVVTWAGARGVEHVAGGYERFAKQWRTPDHGQRVSIAESFQGRIRPYFERGTVSVPRCSLFVDRQAAWW